MNEWKRAPHAQQSLSAAKIHPRIRQIRRIFALTSTGALFLALSAAIPGVFADSQQTLVVDTKARSQDVITHLNAVLRFYRATTLPVQKVGEPNDIVYRDQTVSMAMQAANLAFQSAKAEAALLANYDKQHGSAQEVASGSEVERLQQAKTRVADQQATLKASLAAVNQKLSSGKAKDAAALQTQQKGLQESLDLEDAMSDAIDKIMATSGTAGQSKLTNDINNLQRSVPELSSSAKPVATQLATLDASKSAGVSSQTITLFELGSTERSLDELIQQNEDLRKQAVAFQAPINKMVHNLVVEGQQLSQQTMQAAPSGNTAQDVGQSTDTQLKAVTTGFRSISAASIPLAQEIVVLEQSEANLKAWKSAIDREYASILHTLLARLLVIAIALVVIFLAGELWTRAANKYVKDRRRRRQLLMTRRVVVTFLSALVLLFGFITQFNSLATFAGFITAGIAVGLQTILLSVAAYFFIIGKYGIKVGDRITISGVTGDVIDVGLVRFYVMELAGSGTELKPSGRVAVFSNSVLFQATTPLYKQLPGSDFAWHELIVKFTAGSDPRKASDLLLKTMHGVYDNYRHTIEKDHENLEKWMQVSSAMPEVESRIQFLGGGVQLWTRFPVELRRAAEIDEQLTKALLDLLEKDTELKSIVDGLPAIQPSVKG